MRRLEVFAAAAEAGSFAAAADRLGIQQPSVSAHVRALEAEFGQPLFERRRGRSANLAPAGEILLDHARAVLGTANRLSAEARAQRAAAARRVALACQRLVAHFVLPARLAAFARAHPGIELAVRTGSQAEVLSALAEGSVDLGCFLGNRPPRGLRVARIGTESLLLVAAPGHPLAGRRLRPADLDGQRFVRGSARSLLGREFDAMLRGLGIGRWCIAAQTTEYAMARELVIAGAGLMLALASGVRADLANGALVELDIEAPPLAIGVYLGLPEGRPMPPAARELAAALGAAALASQSPLANSALR